MSELIPRRLNREDLEAVIRRAADIEAQHSSDALDLTEDDVVRIAGEVGLSEQSVRRALTEHYAGSSTEALLVERGWASRLCGPALASVTRRIPESADAVQARLERHFRENESLRLVRRLKAGSLWEPESGVVASLVRSVDLFGRGYQLAKRARAIEVRVVPLDEDECQVMLVADLGKERAGWFWGLGIGAGGAAVGTACGIMIGALSLPVAAAAATPALLALSVGLARAGYSRSVEQMRMVLNGLLDRLEHGEPLEVQRPSWRDLLK